jgi:hypothetical protein
MNWVFEHTLELVFDAIADSLAVVIIVGATAWSMLTTGAPKLDGESWGMFYTWLVPQGP